MRNHGHKQPHILFRRQENRHVHAVLTVLINLLTLIRTQAVKQTLKASHRIHRMLWDDDHTHAAYAFHP